MNEPKFDKESVYDERIHPLMAQIIEVCKEHSIPMVATFCCRNNPDAYEKNTLFCTTAVPGPDNWVPDEIAEARNIIRNGASTRARMAAFTVRKQ